MTKSKVLALLKKQGAEVEIYGDPTDRLNVDICLPEGFIWDSRHGCGALSYELDVAYESASDFWKQIWSEINYPIVKEGE